MMVYVTIAAGVVLSVLGLTAVPAVSAMLGAEGQMLADCIIYGRILLPAVPAFMLQNVFQSFLVTAEKPHQVHCRERRLAYEIGYKQPVHHAIDGSENHHDNGIRQRTG
mgnify:CR=1 FL=1